MWRRSSGSSLTHEPSNRRSMFRFASDKNEKWCVQLLSYATHMSPIINSSLNVPNSFLSSLLRRRKKFPLLHGSFDAKTNDICKIILFFVVLFLFLFFSSVIFIVEQQTYEKCGDCGDLGWTDSVIRKHAQIYFYQNDWKKIRVLCWQMILARKRLV